MARRIALGLAALVAVYLCFATSRAVVLLRSGDGAVQVLGVAIIMIVVLGGYLVFRELRFGFKAAHLSKIVNDEVLPTRAMEEAELDAYLQSAVARAEAEPENWTAWYCVALGYHLHEDRKMARAAMRHAVDLHSRPASAAL